MVKAQAWLDQNYPLTGTCLRKDEGRDSKGKVTLNNYGKTRDQITHLEINQQNLMDSLALVDWIYLEEIQFNNNQITSLKIVNCPQLTRIYALNNQLTNLEGLPISLTYLFIENNQLSGNLNQFSELTNLRGLGIGNYDKERVIKGTYNRWFGSLISLQKLTKLHSLNINNTDLNSGVEYLPISLILFVYDTELRPSCKLKEIEKELEQFDKNRKAYLQFKVKKSKKQKEDKIKELLQPFQWELKPLQEREEFFNNRLNDYNRNYVPELKELLGQGGFAKVYHALWKGNSVAVKKSLYDLTDQEEIGAVKQEVELLKKLRNKYIIQYYDFYQEGQEFMIIIELAEQGTLTDYINSHKEEYTLADWKTNYEFVKHMTLGLSYLHHSNIIHRDLKSANVLITKENIAKIADFGLSQVIENLHSLRTTSRNRIGTVYWMSPEILIHNKPHTFASDIYSLGMTIWEIAAKEIPFNNKSPFEVITAYCRGEREEIPANTPPVLKAIIEGCWKEVPTERISLAQIKEKIESCLTEQLARIEIPPK